MATTLKVICAAALSCILTAIVCGQAVISEPEPPDPVQSVDVQEPGTPQAQPQQSPEGKSVERFQPVVKGGSVFAFDTTTCAMWMLNQDTRQWARVAEPLAK